MFVAFLPSPRTYFEIQVARLIHLGGNHEESFERGRFSRRDDGVQRSKRTVEISGRERSNSRTPREERRSLRGSSDRLPGILSLLTSCGPRVSLSLGRALPVHPGFPFSPPLLFPFSLVSPLPLFSLSKRVNWIGFDFLPAQTLVNDRQSGLLKLMSRGM